jgi:hypothetical protein
LGTKYAYLNEMTRLLITTAAGLLALSPAIAAAQSAEPPRIEVGAQASGHTNERSGLTWTPRLTINLRPDTALEFSADVRQPTEDPFRLEESGQAVSMHLRQTLWENGKWQVSGVVGGGVRRSTIFFPGYTVQRPDGPVTYPDSRFVEYGAAAHIGPSVQVQVAKRLLLRADVRMEFNEDGGLRGMIGAAVPLGQLPPGSRARQRPADSLVNGVAIGTGVGAVTGALTGTFLAALFCENDCAAGGIAFVSVTTATGTAVGGLLGAIIDAVKR